MTIVDGKGKWDGWRFGFESDRLVMVDWPEPSPEELKELRKRFGHDEHFMPSKISFPRSSSWYRGGRYPASNPNDGRYGS